MGQTNLLLRHPTSNTPSALAVLLDVFTVAVVVLSESDFLLLPSTLAATCTTTRLDISPLALHRLLKIHPGMAGTLATWLQALLAQKEAISSLPLQKTLSRCLSIFRYTEAWSEATVWGKRRTRGPWSVETLPPQQRYQEDDSRAFD